MESSSPRAAPPTFLPSPNSHSSSNSSTSSNALLTTRSEPNNPYPTTFVQADTTSFKQVVQLLTGASETIHKQTQQQSNNTNTTIKLSDLGPDRNPIRPVKSPARSKTGFKLFERRNSMKNGLRISPSSSGLVGNNSSSNFCKFSPRKSEILSPSMLDFPSLVLSPVTPLLTDPCYRGSKNPVGSGLGLGLEEKAMAEKGFYLHSLPRQSEEPKLLSLFPVASSKFSGSSSSSKFKMLNL